MITLNGIWYYLSNSTTDMTKMDPLTDPKACTRDAALMSNLGLNLIYVDRLDPEQNHDDCFSIFNSVGIYVALVLRSKNLFVGATDVNNEYTTDLMKETFQWIDAVKDYENLLAVDVGNFPFFTVIDITKYADAQKLYRAFVRDTRDYIKHNAPRPILVGGSLENFETSRGPTRMTMNGSYEHLTCRIPNESTPSWAEYVGFRNLDSFEHGPRGGLNETIRKLSASMRNATTPTWMSAYASSRQNGKPKYEVYNETLVETAVLYNSSWDIVTPYGPMAGGARYEWTNVQLSEPLINWYITTMDSNGNMQLTENYDYLQSIFAQYNTDSWLSGNTVTGLAQIEPRECKPELILNKTSSIGSTRTLSLATDWALPTRPSGLDALITNGARGKRGQMVDVLITKVEYQIKNSKGEVTELALSPSKSEARITTSGPPLATGKSSSKLSTGAKAGIGVGAGVGGILAIAGGVLFLLHRRRRNNKAHIMDHTNGINGTNGANDTFAKDDKSYLKAELSAGPDVEARLSAEMPAGQTPKEVPGDTLIANEYPGMKARMDGPPVELPAVEIPQELPAQPSPAEEMRLLGHGNERRN